MFVANENSALVMEGVREYGESTGNVRIVDGVEALDYEYVERTGAEARMFDLVVKRSRPVIVVVAENEGGYNDTEVDLMDLLRWVKKNRPELWAAAEQDA